MSPRVYQRVVMASFWLGLAVYTSSAILILWMKGGGS